MVYNIKLMLHHRAVLHTQRRVLSALFCMHHLIDAPDWLVAVTLEQCNLSHLTLGGFFFVIL